MEKRIENLENKFNRIENHIDLIINKLSLLDEILKLTNEKNDKIIKYLDVAEKCRWDRDEYLSGCQYNSSCSCKRCIYLKSQGICAACGLSGLENHELCWYGRQ